MTRCLKTTWWTLPLAVSAALAVASRAQNPPSTAGLSGTGKRVLGTHLIDRYEAIQQTRAALKANPNNLNDWIILGELAQEVAGDVPANLAPGYYQLAHEAYDSALKLAPTNASLQAAARFTQEQEQSAEKLAQARRRAVGPYLETRRRELAQRGSSPTVRVYSSAPQGSATPYYYYQPYAGNNAQPYTYPEYQRAHSYPEDEGIAAEPQPGQVLTATERAALVKPAAKFAPP